MKTSQPRPARVPFGRPLVALAVASVVGCQTVKTKDAAPKPPGAGSVGLARPDMPLPKTDFHVEVGADQKFNVHVEMAKVYESQGQNDAALTEYEKALAAKQEAGGGLRRKAVDSASLALAERKIAGLHDKAGRFAKADEHYKAAQKYAPNDPKVWNDFGYSQYIQQHWAEAEQALRTAERLAPGDQRTLTNLGLTYAAQGKTEEALTVLTRAGGKAAAHANVGYVLAGMGRRDEAVDQYRKAILVQPELDPARRALVALQPPPAPPKVETVTTPKPAPAPTPAVAMAKAKAPALTPTVAKAPAPAAGKVVASRLPELPKSPKPMGQSKDSQVLRASIPAPAADAPALAGIPLPLPPQSRPAAK